MSDVSVGQLKNAAQVAGLGRIYFSFALFQFRLQASVAYSPDDDKIRFLFALLNRMN